MQARFELMQLYSAEHDLNLAQECAALLVKGMERVRILFYAAMLLILRLCTPVFDSL
jgi:hypothetical protein